MNSTAFPYPEPDGTRTQGHSGSEASRERAVKEATDGTATARQRRALTLVENRGRFGLTVAELRRIDRLHHGQASSVLSVLHKTGRIVRLSEKRDRCHIYVGPDYVNGRAVDALTKRATEFEAFRAGFDAAYSTDHTTPEGAYDAWKAER